MPYAMYLRKSRADLEAEARGEGETLARHRKTLYALAARLHLSVDAVYQEIVSGDTIEARPQMRRLLADVAARKYDGVLVMEVERLARGDTRDQGTVAQVFKFSGTKIYTTKKIYDPADGADEEYFEFELFMSRREYKTTTRRLQAGRNASVRDGRYMGTRDPFGYRRVKIRGEKGYTLEIVPEQANLVRLMYKWYVEDGHGSGYIADQLNAMRVATYTGAPWDGDRVRSILRNPLYAGYVQWNQRVKTQFMDESGAIVTRRVRSPEQYLCVRGLHEPLIDEALWQRACALFSSHAVPPVALQYEVVNPLGGLVKCAFCGRTMIRRPYKNGVALLRCNRKSCPNTSISLPVIERVILRALADWLKDYAAPIAAPESTADSDAEERAALTAHLDTLHRQRDRLHDLLEQGVYSVEIFSERLSRLNASIQSAQDALSALQAQSTLSRDDAIRRLLPRIAHVLESYDAAPAKERNALLHSVLDHAVYKKEKRCRRNEDPTDFVTLDLFPVMTDSMP